jgi:hypothetical protein
MRMRVGEAPNQTLQPTRRCSRQLGAFRFCTGPRPSRPPLRLTVSFASSLEWISRHMHEGLRLSFLASYAVGPAVAMQALARRGSGGSTAQSRVEGWRWYVPPLLLPVEWLLPPALLLVGLGEIQAVWVPVRLLGLVVAPAA